MKAKVKLLAKPTFRIGDLVTTPFGSDQHAKIKRKVSKVSVTANSQTGWLISTEESWCSCGEMSTYGLRDIDSAWFELCK